MWCVPSSGIEGREREMEGLDGETSAELRGGGESGHWLPARDPQGLHWWLTVPFVGPRLRAETPFCLPPSPHMPSLGVASKAVLHMDSVGTPSSLGFFDHQGRPLESHPGQLQPRGQRQGHSLMSPDVQSPGVAWG